MKSIRLIGVMFSCFVTGSAFAQPDPEFIGVDAQQVYVQTGNNTATPATYVPGVTGPYAFVVTVEGNADLSGYTPAPSFTVPGGSTYGGLLTLALQTGNDWRRSVYYSSSPFADDFPNGTYTVTANGNTISVGLAVNLFPAAPAVTITGGSGTWSGNTLTVNPGTTLTLTTGSFANWETNGALFNHVGLFMNHNGNSVADLESFSDAADPYFASGTGNPDFLAITNYTFTSGTYFVEMEFNAITGIDTTGYPAANSIALNTSRTTFNIQVIPEPSTYAAIFGALACLGVAFKRRRALAGMMIHRRRRTA